MSRAPVAAPPAELAAAGLWVDRGTRPVLRDVSMSVVPGRLLAVLGPNGAGKSTLLHALVGLAPLRRGEVRLGGERIDGLAPERIVRLGIALVPQGRHLFSDLTVREHLGLARFARRPETGLDDPDPWLDRFPEVARQLDVPVGLLSGGQQQLVALIRGLLPRPRVVLLDEPTAALSPAAREAVVAEFRRLAAAGAAVAVVEQEIEAILPVADHTLVMHAGRVTAVTGADSEPAASAAALSDGHA